MYKVRNKVYTDAGYILIGNRRVGYSFEGELSEFKQEKIVINDMKVVGNLLVYSKGRIKEAYDTSATYEQLKAKYVKRLFSNDDQIAIMLNRGRSPEDDVLYDKMQEWRDWCGVLAKKVVGLKDINL